MSTPSVRVAALAFALSSWVEGLTHLRTVLLIPSALERGEENVHQTHPPPAHATWREKIVAWFKRRGRSNAQMDDTERTSMGVVDIATAFVILHMLKQPLLPFLLSPFLTTLPIPRSTSGFKPIKWPEVAFSTLLLSLLHEAERITVFLAVDSLKKRREADNKALLGDVFVRGDDLRPRHGDEDEEEEECLICAGAGPDTTLSQSISSISSLASASIQLDILGPLEAFCATAPQKHIAHRSCFLSWHAAYRQQRMNHPPERVELQHPVPSEANRNRARAILEAAGFAHLGRYLRFPHELPWSQVSDHQHQSQSQSQSQPLTRPILTLTEPPAGPSSQTHIPCRSLATLHTTTPPCPGCRSSVLLHFFSRPLVSSLQDEHACTREETIKRLARLWLHYWCNLVTGRTVLYRLASQWSFVMALLSVMRVSARKPR